MAVELSLEMIKKLIADKDTKSIIDIFVNVPTIDISEACDELEITELIYIIRNIPSAYTADFFHELSQETKENLISSMANKEIISIINEQSADDVTDTISDLPANITSKVLRLIDPDLREDVNKLLRYKEDTCGAIMTTEYLEFLDSTTVDQTIDAIREKGKEAETVYTIFVRNKQRKFVGTVDLDDLIWAKKDQKLEEIMNKDFVFVRSNTDREEAAEMFSRYDLNALAVLNEDDCITGIITIDDAVDVIKEEAAEDIQVMNKVQPIEDEYLKTSSFTMAKKCVPWILLLIVLGTFSSMVLSSFQNNFNTTGIDIAVFLSVITVLTDTGGNAGAQSNGLMVRGLALDEFGPSDFGKIIWKEFKNAVVVGLFVFVFGCFWFTFEQYFGIIHNSATDVFVNGEYIQATIWNAKCWSFEFLYKSVLVSAIIGAALFIAVLIAKLVGVCLPIIAAALKKDPALMSAPFITTIVDVVTLIIYFGLIMLALPLIKRFEVDPETAIKILSSFVKI